MNAVGESATVLLLRDGSQGVEVFMLKRPDAMHFGGAWVFPGGLVDPTDRDDVARAGLDGLTRAQLMARINRHPDARPRAEPEALGLLISACRETFEETGLLLADAADGSDCAADAVLRFRFRHRDLTSRTSFLETLGAEGLRPALSRLQPWAHWITPSRRAKRFDTRFFAVAAPADQSPELDQRESTDGAWCRPADLLARHQAGQVAMLPPTRLSLMDLQCCYDTYGSVAQLLRGELERVVTPILPRIARVGAESYAVYPWDADYASAEGEGIEPHVPVPSYLARLPSRLVVEG